MSQDQFLDVIDLDEAQRRFHAALRLEPLGEESVPLEAALGRVLSRDVTAEVDVPSFDRSNFDGFAVRAADTYSSTEEAPRELRLLDEVLATGVVPKSQVEPGTAVSIATGGMLPRGADAVVMVEHADIRKGRVLVSKAVTPGFGVAFAGTDIGAGEIVLRRGTELTSRETGVLAAIGAAEVHVWRRPRVAVISTGDEIIEPEHPMSPAMVYDSNGRILADAVRELGAEPISYGIAPDNLDELRSRLHEALEQTDVVLLSGGTSKGEGDLSYRVAGELDDPGIVAHGVALKPGKPICLAASRGKPVLVLPGFPTSAIFTFHEFAAPVIRAFGGRRAEPRSTLDARLAVKVNSEIGRTEYLLVGLVDTPEGLSAWPMGQGSGSVTTFSRADGFVTIDRHREIVEAGAVVQVQLLASELRVSDLVVIGSHCVGLDYLLGQLQDQGLATKFLAVGSTAGLQAAQRGQCDVAGIHLLDPDSGQYNRPFVTPGLELIEGYGRVQGIVFRPGDRRFAGSAVEAVERVKRDADCVMVNRNQGSGTRILIDRLLGGDRPAGYAVQARNHNAVAAAVAQGRADWGVAIEWVARHNGLGFLPLADERYDFVVPQARRDRPAVVALRKLLAEDRIRRRLAEMGFVLKEEAGRRKVE
ncbi:MAG: molybdopterin biosynthesis protein [Pirellulales bacterium]